MPSTIVVGDQVAGFHDRLGLQAERRAGGDRGTQQVAGGNVRHLQVFLQSRRLRAFARSGRAEKNQSHEHLLQINDARRWRRR